VIQLCHKNKNECKLKSRLRVHCVKKALAKFGLLIQWQPVYRQLIEHSYIESSKSREETLAGSFMEPFLVYKQPQTPTSPVCIYTTHSHSPLSHRYPDTEVGNSILLSTLEFAQHLPRESGTFADNRGIIADAAS